MCASSSTSFRRAAAGARGALVWSCEHQRTFRAELHLLHRVRARARVHSLLPLIVSHFTMYCTVHIFLISYCASSNKLIILSQIIKQTIARVCYVFHIRTDCEYSRL